MNSVNFSTLETFLPRIPAITDRIDSVPMDDGLWQVHFAIDIGHPLAWATVQEFGYVLNCLSLNERLPCVFKPISPPPYLNGGPWEYLSWVIEAQSEDFSPQLCAEWLEGRLPNPVDDLSQWKDSSDEEGDLEE